MNDEQLEKYSSAVTLSDMEIFVFPELMYALVLANIMSPIIWKWRQEKSFKKLKGKNSYRKLMRLRQYIMDEYEFNLDLETWGLTGKKKELKRFEKYISPENIAGSNALFGYHGDKYYFDVDIRRHFGLDKYDEDIIPYWKTETIEAMDAFRFKKYYDKKAGECVSLSALYAAAAFVVCGIPLEDIYMILTPLHSQNFIDLREGIITNNRRLMTKTQWFNGTAISNKAQRALRNERVTIIAHSSGWIHCLYNDATINKKAYDYFTEIVHSYLNSELSVLSLASFLRSHRDYQRFFQVCRDCHGRPQFIEAETLFRYEHDSDFKLGDETHQKLLEEVADDDFSRTQLPNRIRCDRFDEFLNTKKPDVKTAQGRSALKKFLEPAIPDVENFVKELSDFIYIEPKLPDINKNFKKTEPLKISPQQTREQIIEYLSRARTKNETAELAFYAYRDMQTCNWTPFIKAAVERNPVSIQTANSKNIEQTYEWLRQMQGDSIYDGKRLAQPDEVINFQRGDGLEKAFALANIIRSKNPERNIRIEADSTNIVLRAENEYRFESNKDFHKQLDIPTRPGDKP